jgi:hypothetical protein
MPIPLYISPNTPLPGPADFTSPIIEAMRAAARRKEQEQESGLRREQMQQQVSENAKDREQRAGERKETNEYNRGMLDLYRGDRKDKERLRLQEAEDKANQEYLVAYAKDDQVGMELAQQKIEQLRKKQADAGQPPAAPARAAAGPGQARVRFDEAPPTGLGSPLSSSRMF